MSETKIKYFHVNWQNGMNISKEHFIQMENAFTAEIADARGVLLNNINYGLFPVGIGSQGSVKTVIKIDNQKFLRVRIFSCQAVTRSGARIDILEEHQLPELESDISMLLDQAGSEGEYFYILFSVNAFNRQPFGELNTFEEPPRHPYTIPGYGISLVSEKDLLAQSVQPDSLIIGKLKIEQGVPEIAGNYLPSCMTVKSHMQLMEFCELTEKIFSQLELNLLSIIRKINEKNQDTSLAKSVGTLSENLLNYISENHLRLRFEIPNQPPVFLFMYIANAARVIRNTIDSDASANKEELLNYFTNWSELKQGDFEKLLVYCINFEYRHFDTLLSVEQFGEFLQIIARLFEKLEALTYIGKKKETSIFVKEQKTGRSFLAD
ncbi:MAG: hypothetical protein RBS23_05970 [Mariniphaga sp.]|jgi:hypothetical protein|nr:hypothetical protein [Mariniphaga sp.]